MPGGQGRADSTRPASPPAPGVGVSWDGPGQTGEAPSPSTIHEGASEQHRTARSGTRGYKVGPEPDRTRDGAGRPIPRCRGEGAALHVAAGEGERPRPDDAGPCTDPARPSRTGQYAPLRQSRQRRRIPDTPEPDAQGRDPRQVGQDPEQPGQEAHHTVNPCLANEVECRFQRRPGTSAPVLTGPGEPEATRSKAQAMKKAGAKSGAVRSLTPPATARRTPRIPRSVTTLRDELLM
jgi:hypothetical protein